MNEFKNKIIELKEAVSSKIQEIVQMYFKDLKKSFIDTFNSIFSLLSIILFYLVGIILLGILFYTYAVIMLVAIIFWGCVYIYKFIEYKFINKGDDNNEN